MLKEKSLNETSIEDITTKAGVAKGSFYTYFKRKEDTACCSSLDKYDSVKCDHTYYHIARSGVFSIEKAQRLLEYQPKYTCLETIDLAVKSYIDRGLIRLAE